MSGFRRFIVAAALMAALLVAMASGYGYWRWSAELRARAWVDHAHEVIETTFSLSPWVQETGIAAKSAAERAGSQDQAALRQFRRAEQGLIAQQRRLTRLTAGNSAQAGRVKALNAGLDAWRTSVETDLAQALRRGRPTNRLAPLSNDAYAALLLQARASGASIVAAERRIEIARRAALDRTIRTDMALALALISTLAAGMLGLVAALAFANRNLRRAQEQTRLSRASEEQSLALIDAVFANIPDFLFILDQEPGPTFRIADFNPSLARFFDVTRAQVRGLTLADRFQPAVAQDLTSRFSEVLASGKPSRQRRIIFGPDGRSHLWEATLAPVTGGPEPYTRLVGAARDVTAEVDAQSRLHERQRLEAIGQLTGGVAHDFNNLLQIIRGNLELLSPLTVHDPEAARRLEHAIQGADRAARLTSQLLAFARRQPLAPEPLDLAALTSEFVDLTHRTLGEGIEIVTRSEPGLWWTLADPTQVQSCLLNLAINARDAMPGGGRLTIELANVTLGAAEAATLELPTGDFIRVTVSDTGEGMTPETLARAFEPLFTTKPRGKGTGLGLSMVYGFVTQSQGAIRLTSEPGQGLTVRIWLPRSADPAPVEEGAATSPATEGPGRVALVVEDEPQVRAASVSLLTELGFACREAVDPLKALDLVGPEVSLVFSDVLMPGDMDAQAFAAEIRRRLPTTPIIFTSGYADGSLLVGALAEAGAHFLAKPFTRESLAKAVGWAFGHTAG